MKYAWLLCLCVLVGVATAGMMQEDDEEEEAGNVGFKFSRTGGKLRMGRKGKADDDSNGMEAEFVGLSETNENGEDMPERPRGPGKKWLRRRFMAFRKLRFNVTKTGDIEFGDLSWRGIEVEAKLRADGNDSDAVLKVQVLIAKEAGEVTIGEEVQNITKGTIKMNIELNNWEFCNKEGDNCTDASDKQAGKAVVLAMRIKSKKAGKKLKRRAMKAAKKGKKLPEMFQFGENGEYGKVAFSRMVETDGEVGEMPEGWPRTRDTVQGTEVMLFFPRFKRKILYDPVFETAGVDTSSGEGPTDSPDDETTTPDGGASSLLASSLLLLLTSILARLLL